MRIDKTEVYGFESAVRGMRNPLNSWDKSDSSYIVGWNNHAEFELGGNDIGLAKRLISGGTEHSKFLRFITVTADLELPLYLWKEWDTYKFVEKNSCSTMHKITSRELTKEDFEYDIYDYWQEMTLERLNELIKSYKAETLDVAKQVIFRQIVQDLPSAYLQKRTIITNYAELMNMYRQRKHHKLKEWHIICDWIKSLPYMEEFIGEV